jgi:hypothetical protein
MENPVDPAVAAKVVAMASILLNGLACVAHIPPPQSKFV